MTDTTTDPQGGSTGAGPAGAGPAGAGPAGAGPLGVGAGPVGSGAGPVGAVRGRPAFNGEMWREVLFLLLNLPLSIVGFVLTVAGIALGGGLMLTVVGFWVLAGSLFAIRGYGGMERRLVRSLLAEDIAEPLPVGAGRNRGSVWRRVFDVLSDGLAWRTALYLFIKLPWGILTFTVTVVALVILWPVLPWVTRGLSTVDRLLAGSLLAPADLSQRVRELEQDRGTVVDSAAADLRRIERDLHDGAQARLVALAMDLGLAKEKLAEDPEAAGKMVADAHGEVKLVLQELRDLARGIHPAVLTDRGLDAALSSVATRCTVPGGVRVNADLPGGSDRASRPDSAVEGIAYFTVSELLTNISKHAAARTATVDAWRSDDRLMLQVKDDGKGGALESPGGGLAGLAERIRAVDGVFVVDSPVGGPTTVTVELPWRTRGRS